MNEVNSTPATTSRTGSGRPRTPTSFSHSVMNSSAAPITSTSGPTSTATKRSRLDAIHIPDRSVCATMAYIWLPTVMRADVPAARAPTTWASSCSHTPITAMPRTTSR